MGFESRLEPDRLILLDFGWASGGDRFALFFPTAEGKRRLRAPDYFARPADGSALPPSGRPGQAVGAGRVQGERGSLHGAEDALTGGQKPRTGSSGPAHTDRPFLQTRSELLIG